MPRRYGCRTKTFKGPFMTLSRHILLLGMVTALAACSSNTVKQKLGLTRQAPDEFRVVSEPPLSVPPEFSLRPPSAPGDAPSKPASDQQAKALITGVAAPAAPNHGDTFNLKPSDATTAAQPTATKPTAASGSAAEAQFLSNAGADKADPKVRAELVVQKEQKEEAREEESWWSKLTGAEKKDPVVDAAKEQQRIQDDKATGKPVTDGDTPNVKQKDTGVLGSIFGY